MHHDITWRSAAISQPKLYSRCSWQLYCISGSHLVLAIIVTFIEYLIYKVSFAQFRDKHGVSILFYQNAQIRRFCAIFSSFFFFLSLSSICTPDFQHFLSFCFLQSNGLRVSSQFFRLNYRVEAPRSFFGFAEMMFVIAEFRKDSPNCLDVVMKIVHQLT